MDGAAPNLQVDVADGHKAPTLGSFRVGEATSEAMQLASPQVTNNSFHAGRAKVPIGLYPLKNVPVRRGRCGVTRVTSRR